MNVFFDEIPAENSTYATRRSRHSTTVSSNHPTIAAATSNSQSASDGKFYID